MHVRCEPSLFTHLDGRDDMPLFFASARSASKNSAPGTDDEAGTAAAGAGAGAGFASGLSGTASPEAAASAAAGRAGGWNDASGTTSAASGRAARWGSPACASRARCRLAEHVDIVDVLDAPAFAQLSVGCARQAVSFSGCAQQFRR
jgi:hypothetical protein